MELRLAFDTVPELFDRYRPRYCAELFSDLIAYTDLGPGKRVLELGPGTGQATDPILATGCDYLAIELGVNLYEKMISKYPSCPNFSIINDDFITHDFGYDCFDLIYSAATIQWIPEETAFRKTFSLLKPGGTLAMMLTRGDYRTPNEKLYSEIQAVYEKYYRPKTPYTHGSFRYTAAVEYGFTDMEKREYQGSRIFTSEEYAAFLMTHCDHIVIPEPYRTKLIVGIRDAISADGDRIEFSDTHILYLARKPL